MIETRPARPEDFPRLARIFHEAVHQIARADYSPGQLEAWSPRCPDAESWSRRLATLEVRVAMWGGELAGFVGFTSGGHLDLLYTMPGFTRRGVARELVEEAERWYRRAGVDHVTAEASLTARPLFEACEFKVVRAQMVSRRGADMVNFKMEKHLV